MLEHWRLFGYDRDVFDYLWELIRAMDATYLNHLGKKTKRG
jgi:hypothetical protein